MELEVGRIGKVHGVRGEVVLDVRTDEPDRRFAAGSVLQTDPADRGPLTVAQVKWHSGRLVVAFVGVEDRNAAAQLRGTRLVIDSDDLEPLADPDEFYDHELIGLAVVTTTGTRVGLVDEVVHSPGGELLVIRRESGRDALVPFVREIVPTVDIASGQLVLDPPPGLLEL